MINSQPIEPTKLAAVATLVIVTLLGAFGTFAQTNAAPIPLLHPTTGENYLAEMPGFVNNYPTVVGYVDGHPITGFDLAFHIYAIEQNNGPTVDKSHPVRDALHTIIQDQILTEHAQDYGISTSYAEGRAFAQQAEATMVQAPEGRAQLKQLAEAEGVDPDDYFSLPTTIQGYRYGLTLGKMRFYVFEHAPIAERNSEAGDQAALDAFTSHIHANVKLLIDVP